MTEDFLNGFNIVPLEADKFTLSPTAVSDLHPWRDILDARENPLEDKTSIEPLRLSLLHTTDSPTEEDSFPRRSAEGEYPLSSIDLIHSGLLQLLLIDVDGREQHNEKSKSLSNDEEIRVLLRLLKKFPKGDHDNLPVQGSEVEVLLQEILDKEYKLDPVPEKQYTVLTVDSAQGKEKPIVILMTTRTQKATDFFCSTERCNVAVSRQQKALIILGKAPLLTTNKPWSTVVNGDDFNRIKAEDI